MQAIIVFILKSLVKKGQKRQIFIQLVHLIHVKMEMEWKVMDFDLVFDQSWLIS